MLLSSAALHPQGPPTAPVPPLPSLRLRPRREVQGGHDPSHSLMSIEEYFRRLTFSSILGDDAEPVSVLPAGSAAALRNYVPQDRPRDSVARDNEAAPGEPSAEAGPPALPALAAAAPEIPALIQEQDVGEAASPPRTGKRLSFTLRPRASRKKAKTDGRELLL